MARQQKSALNVVLGAMNFGTTTASRVNDLKEIKAILAVFQQHGHSEVDTARIYNDGTSEEVFGDLGWQERGFVMDTKLWPTVMTAHIYPHPELLELINHSPESIRKNLKISLEALKAQRIDMFYLHAPDRTVPFELTLKAVDELYREGCFKRFGLSNFAAWEVAEVVGICKANGFVQPTAYQGAYNALNRNVEPELMPCLRKYGMSFYAFSALAGGFFSGKYFDKDQEVEAGTRFDTKHNVGQSHRARYWNDEYFKAMAIIRPIAAKHGLEMGEIALRWISHHSQMKREHGDSVIIGASTTAQLEQNLVDLEKGALPEDVLQALDEAYRVVQHRAASYFLKV